MIGTINNKTEYSMLNSTVKLEQFFEYTKKANFNFITLTDTNLHALYKFFKLSQKHNLKPIIGLEININFRDLNFDLLTYARNDFELERLIELSSLIQSNNEKDFSNLIYLIKDLLVCLPTNQPNILKLNDNLEELFNIIENLNKKLTNFTIGISYQDEVYFNMNQNIKKIVNKLNINLLPTRTVRYLDFKDKKTYNILKKIENQTSQDEVISMNFLTEEKLKLEYQDALVVFDNLEKIFLNVEYNYLTKNFILPTFPTKNNTNSKDYLAALSKAGLKKRLEKINDFDELIYQNRLTHELTVIDKMGYNDYFLIVYDFVRFAKTNDILVGPGRGSAAGSLVAYCLGITEVDPITYDLLFERFLNIDRKTMPDIDLDFPDNKRDEVINYVKEKYGNKKVVTISTFTTFAERSSIRDIARILKIDNQRTSAIINASQNNKLDETDLEAIELLGIAKKLEGLPRQTGTHAAGVILSSEPLDKYVPLQQGPHQMLQSQLEASDLESLGFLKIDFLGLRNLAIIDEIYKLENIKIKLNDIPLNDKDTFETLKKVETVGIFQLESQGMKNVIRKLQPDNFEDIVALLALFRPGPMEFIDDYIKSRHGAKFDLVDESIDHILKPTYGIIVYQEQIMKIAQLFAGYSLSQADLLRRGIAKKDKEILEKEKANFISKSKDQNRDEETAIKIYNYIEKFANYGFNRSHSVAYALLAYQMAYLKTHYFLTFMAVLMSSVSSNTELLLSYIKEVKVKNYQVKRPDINLSTTKFINYNHELISPLTLVKGIGITTVEKILEERLKNKFKDYNDFKLRMKGVLNEKNLISLIHAGALDSFNLTHATMLKSTNLGQTGFESFLDDYKEIELKELSFDVLKSNELEVLGFNIVYTNDPRLLKLMEKHKIKNIEDNQSRIKIIGSVVKVKEFITKSNKLMAFVDLVALNTEISATIFDKEYSEYKNLLKDTYLVIYLTKNEKGYNINKIEKV